MFVAAGKQLLLLLMGDDWQLPSIHEEGADKHPRWKPCRFVQLVEVCRCKCPELQAKLNFLRCHKPMGEEGKRFINKLCYQHKAWSGHDEPNSIDIDQVLGRTEGKTTFVTCTRRGASIINDLVLQVLFTNRNKRSIGTIPGDYGDLADNYTQQGHLREDRVPIPHCFRRRSGCSWMLRNHTCYWPSTLSVLRAWLPTSYRQLYGYLCPSDKCVCVCVTLCDKES